MNINTRQELNDFIIVQELKLRRNDFKGGWKDCDPRYLFDLLQDELFELEMAIQRGDDSAMWECADVANFAMMIWDVLRERNVKP